MLLGNQWEKNDEGGYFPGSKNGGAELHSVIANYETGVQVEVVVNLDLNLSEDDVADAYNAAFTSEVSLTTAILKSTRD